MARPSTPPKLRFPLARTAFSDILKAAQKRHHVINPFIRVKSTDDADHWRTTCNVCGGQADFYVSADDLRTEGTIIVGGRCGTEQK